MKLRTATYAEVTQIQRLMYATIDISYSGHYPPRALPLFKTYHSVERIRQRMSDGLFVVVEDSDGLAATGALVGEEIFAVFVSPSRQGLGIGRMVMDALEQRAREHGLDRVRLDASLPSTGFYVNRGYRLLERCSMDAGEGQSLDWWKAQKVLTDRGHRRSDA